MTPQSSFWIWSLVLSCWRRTRRNREPDVDHFTLLVKRVEAHVLVTAAVTSRQRRHDITTAATVCVCVCVCNSLVEQRHRGAPLALLHHVGLVSKANAQGGGGESTRLAVHLHTHKHTTHRDEVKAATDSISTPGS